MLPHFVHFVKKRKIKFFGLTQVAFGQWANHAEEPFVQNLQKLQSCVSNVRSRASGVHQSYVNNGRVMVARVLPLKNTENQLSCVNFVKFVVGKSNKMKICPQLPILAI